MHRSGGVAGGVVLCAALGFADLSGVFEAPLEHPAIQYGTRAPKDPVAELNRRIQEGSAQLRFTGESGYLAAVLEALRIPLESQIAVASKTSFQAYRISPQNPRAVYFNDTVAVGWVRGGPVVELAAQDPQQGIIFYTLDQTPGGKAEFTRSDHCLGCHESHASMGVPGMIVRSVPVNPNGTALYQFGNYTTDHRSPLSERWGGYYVTGKAGGQRHMGNTITRPTQLDKNAQPPELTGLDQRINVEGYLTPHSDIVALMVFEHQMHAMNLLTRIGWEARYAAYEKKPVDALMADAAREVVDYLLFVDEAQLTGRIEGSSRFTAKFSALGPVDGKGRGLRQFDLERRLMLYPCSYTIYSAAFDALPAVALEAIYRRLWEVLSGEERGAKYARLSLTDRRAVVEILRDTKKQLPNYFTVVQR
jgi:hypothetical protein